MGPGYNVMANPPETADRPPDSLGWEISTTRQPGKGKFDHQTAWERRFRPPDPDTPPKIIERQKIHFTPLPPPKPDP